MYARRGGRRVTIPAATIVRKPRRADAELQTKEYRARRAWVLARAAVCGICGRQDCPHCHGEKRHCGSRLGHLDHDKARSRGGRLVLWNEQAAHACCNLKKGAKDGKPEILITSKRW